MSSKNQAKKAATPTSAEKPPVPNGPEGYQKSEQRFDLAGYWKAGAGALHGLLLGAYEFKKKSGRGKGQKTRVFVFRLLDPCMARVKLEGGGFDEAELSKGEVVGVFYSAGLRELNTLLGCKVFILRNPEDQKKETERGAMWTFDVRHSGVRKPVAVRPAFEREREAAEEEDASFDPSTFQDSESEWSS
jgi:hypothetical protein